MTHVKHLLFQVSAISLVIIVLFSNAFFLHSTYFEPIKTAEAAVGDGAIIYDETTPTTDVQTRLWTESTATIGSEISPFTGSGTSKHTQARGSAVRQEMLLGIQDSAGTLTMYKSIDEGASWQSQWTATVGDGNLRRFDIAYEQSSGDALIIYSGNVGTTNELRYRTWNGTTWSGELTLDAVRTTGTIYGIKIAERSGSDVVGVVWVDTNFDVSSNVWSGSAWATEPTAALSTNLSKISTSAVPTNRAFDIAFESLSGDMMVIWGDDAGTDPKYVIRTAAGVWGAVVSPTTFNEEATMVDIASSPISDKIAYANCTDNGGDCDFAVWSGSVWGTTANDATSRTPTIGDSGNNVDWLISGANEVAIFTYSDNGGAGLDWYTSINGATPTVQTDNSTAPTIAGAEQSGFARVSPTDPSQGVFVFVDANSDVYLKKASLSGTTVTWSSPSGAGTALETSVTFPNFNPVAFAYTRFVSAPAATLTIAATAGSKITTIASGTTTQYLNTTTCASAATCAAFTLSLSSGSDTVTSIKITQNGTLTSTDLSNIALFYDTDGNFSNGMTGQFGTTQSGFTTNAATFSGSLAVTSGTTYYFYVRLDALNGATNPTGGQTLNVQVAANTDITTSGSVAKTGAPVSLAGTTTVVPQITGYTNSTEAGLSYSAACTGCGARIGGGVAFRQALTISGFGFGNDPGLGSRDTATNKVEIAGATSTTIFSDDASANTNVSAWSKTSITIRTDTSISGNADSDWGTNFGGPTSLKITAGGQAVPTNLNFYLFPQITSITSAVGLPTDAAREYDAGDSDGVIILNGTRFGAGQTGGYVRMLGCDATTCSSPTGTVVTNTWTNTSIAARVPTVIADNAYTGSLVVQQGLGSRNKTATYANTIRILPRITSLAPTSGSIGDGIIVNGNHFCQNAGTCPTGTLGTTDANLTTSPAFTTNDRITFTSGVVANYWNGWTSTAATTRVPSGAATGDVVLKSNGFDSNGVNFTVATPTPSDPTSLNQFSNAGLTLGIPVGGGVTTTPLYLTMTMDVGVSGGTLYPQIEYKAVGTPFTCSGTAACASATEGAGVAGPGPIDCADTANACAIAISPATNIYHWQARVRHNKSGVDYYSNWISFPTDTPNLESETDFNLDSDAPTISNVSSGIPSTNSATITWDTLTEPSTSQVQYNTTGTFNGSCSVNNDCTTLNVSLVNTHSINLANLNSGTLYYFRVRSKDSIGNEALSSSFTFTTASVTQPSKTVRFHVLSNPDILLGGTATSTSFTVYIPEDSPSMRSVFLEIRAIFDTSGAAPNSIAVQVNGEPVRTYELPTGTSAKNEVKIIHEVSSLALDPSSNTISITPQSNVDLSALSADLSVTYSYTP
jgi:hypothetical protein